MELVEFPDPVVAVLDHLDGHLPAGTSLSLEPRPDDHRGLWVQVVDVGGAIWEQVFDDARVLVEVSCEDSIRASTVARRCDALLRAFHTSEGRWLAQVHRPHYLPDPDIRVPAYQLTHTLRFRGVEVDTSE